jgi:hypothetical protein
MWTDNKGQVMEWTFIDNEMPNEGEYVLVTSGENSPIGISRFIDGEWDTGVGHKRPVFTKTERFLTSASIVYWMPLPKQPERSKREDSKIRVKNPILDDPCQSWCSTIDN